MATKVLHHARPKSCLSHNFKNTTVAPEGDIYVKLADDSLESFSIGLTPGAFLVDFFPICVSTYP